MDGDEIEVRLRELKEKARSRGIDESKFEFLWNECSESLKRSRRRRRWKRIFIIALLLLILVPVAIYTKWFDLAFCKIQHWIYPGLRILRIISIPIISMFPSLTELYDETCLIKNPFFRITDLECWPCGNVDRVVEISKADDTFLPETMSPFIFKSNQQRVSFDELKRVYVENDRIFSESAPRVIVNDKTVIQTKEFFENYNENIPNTYRWRLNRMSPGRLVRTLFPRPIIVPKLGQSTERFIMVDGTGSGSYELPEPECNYVFVIQGSGERYITLRPVNECHDECKSISVLLKESYVLWYNWWYWRPVSHWSKTNATSISYVGSYC